MKLHPDGTIEGTPAEIAEYGKLKSVQQHPLKFVDPVMPKTVPTQGNPLIPWTTTIENKTTYLNEHVLKKQHENGNTTYEFL